MWCFNIASTLLFVLKLGEVVPGEPNTSKSIGGDSIDVPMETNYVANNTKLEVKCVIKGGDNGVPDLQFVNDADNIELRSSPRRRLDITFVKDPVKNTTTGTFSWNPIYVRDNVIKNVRCRNKETKHSKTFGIVVIPSVSIPKVEITNGSEARLQKGLSDKLICVVTCTSSGVVKDFSAMWKMDNLNSKKSLPANTKPDTKKKNSTAVISTLKFTKINDDNKGKYYCIARMKFEAFEIVRQYHALIDVKVIREDGSEVIVELEKKKEIKSKEGKRATLDCLAIGSPKPKAKWWKQNEYNKKEVAMLDLNNMDSRYTFEESFVADGRGEESAPNSVLIIKNLAYTDRSQYVCRVETSDRNVTTTFTLRVADPLGILWPCLGIIIEAIVLFIVIFYYQTCRTKKGKKTQKDENPRKHEPPAKSGPPKMSELDTDNAPLMSSNEEVSSQRPSKNEVTA